MVTNSNFTLKNIAIDDYRVLCSGIINCHKKELIFHFQGFSIKMEFLEEKKKKCSYVLDSSTIPATLKCFNFSEESTPEPYEIVNWSDKNLLLSCPAQLRKEKLYISFVIKKIGDIRIISYTFFIKDILEYV